MRKILTALALVVSYSHAALAYNDPTRETKTTMPTGTGERVIVEKGGFYAEPFVSLSRDTSSMGTSSLADTSGRIDGFGLGTRLGIHALETVFLGVDARYHRSRMLDSFYQSADGSGFNYGPMIGAQMPWYGLRAWAGYVLGGEFDPRSGNNGLDVRFRDPRGFRVGTGIHFEAASVNLEYQDLVYDTTQVQSTGTVASLDTSRFAFASQGFTLSLSVPLEL